VICSLICIVGMSISRNMCKIKSHWSPFFNQASLCFI
jgi:hypothetical protein